MMTNLEDCYSCRKRLPEDEMNLCATCGKTFCDTCSTHRAGPCGCGVSEMLRARGVIVMGGVTSVQ